MLQRTGCGKEFRGGKWCQDPLCDQRPPPGRYCLLLFRRCQGQRGTGLGGAVRHSGDVCWFLEMAEPESQRVWGIGKELFHIVLYSPASPESSRDADVFYITWVSPFRHTLVAIISVCRLSLALFVFVSNLFGIQKRILLAFIWLYHKYATHASQYEIDLA